MKNTGRGYRLVAAALSDTVAQASGPFDAIYVSVAGTLSVDTAEGTNQANANCALTGTPVGIIPIRGRRINSTGTAATGVFCAYLDVV